MIGRRGMLKLCAAMPVAASWPWPSVSALPSGIDAAVIDRRFPEAAHILPYASVIYELDGDVTDLWFGNLDLAWRKRGHVVAGVTGRDVLFVLERLAWDRGRRVTMQQEVGAGRPEQWAPVRWIIAPVHPSVRS